MKKALSHILTLAFWLAVWIAASVAIHSEILLPSPPETARALLLLFSQTEFYLSVLFSMLRILAGFFGGTLLGILFGAVTYRFGFLRTLFAPLMSTVKATPVASFIVLLFVWFTSGTVTSVTSMLIVLPIIWSDVSSALASTDQNLLEMAAAFRVPKKTVLTKLYLPSVLPSFKSAAATALGLSWKAGIAAEVICNATHSVGGGIYTSKVYLDTPQLFAWTLVVILLSVILEKVMLRFLKLKGAPKND